MNETNRKDGTIIAVIFDSGKIEDCFYGKIVFKGIFSGKEVTSNPRKIIVSMGEIFDYHIFEDITPYLIRNDLCTIERSQDRYRNNANALFIETGAGIGISAKSMKSYRLKEKVYIHTEFGKKLAGILR